MNRTIKFRGMRKDKEIMVYGDLIHGVNSKKGKMFILPIRGGVISLSYGIDPIDGYEVIPETVGQFTGLKDIKGNEIYENDIVKDNHENKFVTDWRGQIEYTSGWWLIIDENHEVIGNIFDNPELLNE